MDLNGNLMRSPYLLATMSGVLLGTSFIPFPPWAIFFCYVPLWLVWLTGPSWKRVFWTGWLAQFVGTLIGFNWGGLHRPRVRPLALAPGRSRAGGLCKLGQSVHAV